MRKSKIGKARQSDAYQRCLADGGHQPVTVDKRIEQTRCKRCDYCTSKS